MATTESLKQQVQTTQQNQVANQPKPQTIDDYMKKMAPAMAQALPKHMDIDRLTRLAMTTIRTTPALKDADVGSLLGAVMQAAQLGLEPGLMGHCYLLPFNNKNKGIKEVQFIIGYKGMIDLARRSGHIKSIYAHAVYSNDEFDYELGLESKLVHKPTINADKGEFVGAYAVAHFKDGGYQFEFMSKADIEKRKGRSKAANSKFSPWTSDYEEMAKKTVVRHMWKYLPISVEVQQQVAYDEGTGKDISKIKDVTPDDTMLEAPDYELLDITDENTEG
ncbi:recombination protein RecT [Macrococcus psychrotolerans]|uniref:Recombination protein RecT n=1 Tax=Macrococcus psychrotolerans TaxID=3039389 RepID=A0AAT9P424_9STAP|nr:MULTISPECIES: recombination protein RecT [Macrococcus]QYA32021.1 recombination protein RecT [Macrococcus sp. 19Msa1099]QYA36827.1 recombination protein RecT [Macrococcus caseolyticus]QYA75535.1 recombination protein RecT [Macrococcus caseolyticus]